MTMEWDQSILCTVCDKWCSGLGSLNGVVDFQHPVYFWRSRGEKMEIEGITEIMLPEKHLKQ